MFANGWELLATFLPFLQQLATFPHFANFCLNLSNSLATFGSFCQLLPMFATGWKLLAIFYIFLQYLAISRQLLIPVDTFGNFSQILHSLATFANFLQLCHFWQLLATFGNFCHPAVLSCHHIIWWSGHIVIFTSCHSVLLSSCQSGSLSKCQLVNLQACELLSLWTFQLEHLGACELVLHIWSMISFGGFLAECLPCLISYNIMPIFVNFWQYLSTCANVCQWSLRTCFTY